MISEDFDCWESPNQLKLGFHDSKHRLVKLSSLGPLPLQKCVNNKIKNISSRKVFKEHQTNFLNQYLQKSRHFTSAHFWVILKNNIVFDNF